MTTNLDTPSSFAGHLHGARLALFAALLVGGCLQASEPQAGDSSTSWLTVCVRDGECGRGSCISDVCTLACEAGRDAVCAPLSPEAECRVQPEATQGFCDVGCTISTDCGTLGADWVCRDGHCRQGSRAGDVEPPVVDAGDVEVPVEQDPGSDSDSTQLEVTLLSLLSQGASDPFTTPLEVLALDSTTGQPLEPPVRATSEAGTGRVVLDIDPESNVPSLQVVGAGSGEEDAHDSVHLNFVAEYEPGLLWVGQNGLADLPATTGEYQDRADRAPLMGAIYWHRKDGPREGTVGCAKVFLDGSSSEMDDDSDQRYVAENGLPTSPSRLTQTLPTGGFHFGNLTTGRHTLRVSVDGGQSFLGAEEFVVSRARQDALGPSPNILYVLSIDLEAESDPTPEDCSQ